MQNQMKNRMKRGILSILVSLLFVLFLVDLTSAANLIVFNKSNAAQQYFVVNGSTGSVGIGTTTPSRTLDVRGIGNFSGTIYLNNNTDVISNLTSLWSAVNAGAGTYNSTYHAYTVGQNATVWSAINAKQTITNTTATYVPYTGANKNTALGVYNLTTTGMVGVGKTTPIAKLDVTGSFGAVVYPSDGSGTYAISNNSFVIGAIYGGGIINSSGWGSFVQGASSGSSSYIIASGDGTFAQGQTSGTSVINSTTSGSFARGASFTNSNIVASYSGAYAGGYAFRSRIIASGLGSVAQGSSSTAGTISASGQGSFAQGAAFNGSINSTNTGSIAQGYALYGNISASGTGSFAGGSASYRNIVASGEGAFVWGNGSSSTANHGIVFGQGIANAIANSFSVGFNSATPRLFVNGSAVGVGTTTPRQTFEVVGSGNFSGTVFIDGNKNLSILWNNATYLSTYNSTYQTAVNNASYLSTYNSSYQTITNTTATYVPYTGANKAINLGANSLTVDTNVLYVDVSNDRVGVGTTSPSSSFDVEGRTSQFSNTGIVYRYAFGGSQDLDWKGIANVTMGAGIYEAVSFEVKLIDAMTNSGGSVDVRSLTYYVSMRGNDAGNYSQVSGPIGDYVRAVKTVAGKYELQVRQVSDWRHMQVEVQQLSTCCGTASVSYVTTPTNGSISGDIYNSTSIHTNYFANLAINGRLNVSGNLYANSTHVGIGTSTPLYPLHVNGLVNAAGYMVNGSYLPTGINVSGTYVPYTGASGNVALGVYNLTTTGMIGVGTTTPSAKLDIRNGALLVNGSVGDTPISGAGRRFMWVPSKGAIRFGGVFDDTIPCETDCSDHSQDWDDGSIGLYSIAGGINTAATGDGSIALGILAASVQYGSVAIGSQSFAAGINSIAIGDNAAVSGDSSYALGMNSVVSGNYGSIAVGQNNKVSGSFGSFAGGRETMASGNTSFAYGQYVNSYANHTITLGRGTSAAWLNNTIVNSLQVGFNSATPTLFVNGSSVGIGTTTPNSKLQVSGLVNAQGYLVNGTPLSSGGSGLPIFYNISGTIHNNITYGSALNVNGSFAAIHYDNSFTNGYYVGPKSFLLGSLGNSGHINSSGPGALATGYSAASGVIRTFTGEGAFARGYSYNSANISAYGQGSTAQGFAYTSGNIIASNWGSIAMGAAYTGSITSSGPGSFAGGYVQGGSVTSSGYGSFVWGNASSSSGNYGVVFGTGIANSIANSFSVGFGASSVTPTLFVNGSGVGIGTTTPRSKLYISSATAGDSVLTLESDTDNNDENDNSWVYFRQDGALVNAFVGLAGDAGTFAGQSVSNVVQNAFVIHANNTDSASYVQIATNNSARLTVDPTGKVGIGTTAPAFNLDVIGGIQASTNMTAVAYYYSSDARLKKNIAELNNSESLEKIMQLRPVTFNWIDSEKGAGNKIGLIAQDVETVFPELIGGATGKDGVQYKSVEYGNLVSPIISAIQEQQNQIEQLKAENAKRDSEMEQLRKEIEALKAK